MPMTQLARATCCAAFIVVLTAIGTTGEARATSAPSGSAAGAPPAPGGISPGTGNADCAAAAAREDARAARSACAPGRAAGNAVDGYNLALALWPTAPDEARELLQSSADAGLAEAAHLLGNMALDEGDAQRGLAQLEAAAQAGLALAQFDYATALLERDAQGDRAEAVRWYGRAAAGGENAARYNLAVLMLGGRLGATRALQAWAWLSSLDPLESHAEVQRLASELAGQMNAPERSRAAALLQAVRDDPVSAAEALAREVADAAGSEGRGDDGARSPAQSS